MAITKQTIIKQLIDLGISEGDVVFVAADLMKVGYFNKSIKNTLNDWISIFDTVLGESGTIVIPSYSPTWLRFVRDSGFTYTLDSPSNSGSMARAYLEYADNTIRGTHPTSSCLVKGFHAKFIASRNTEKHLKYEPYKSVVELKGKSLLLGTVDRRNGPFTFHYAQQILGHTTGHPYSGLLKTRYIDQNGHKKDFIVREIGGCTGGLHKSWGYHLEKKAVTFGAVGKSLSALVNAEKSTQIFIKLLSSKPYSLKCDNVNCVSCYGRFRYNGFASYWYYVRAFPTLLLKLVQKLRSPQHNA